MLHRTLRSIGFLALLAVAGVADETRFPLVRCVPADAFLCAAARHNPERAFLDEYWGEVFQAAVDSGICQDLFGLIGSFMDEEQRSEMARLTDLAWAKVNAVDWEQLFGGEVVFAERMPAPVRAGSRGVHMGPADMVMLLRGAGGAEANYTALCDILATLAKESNQLADAEVLRLDHSRQHGADVASVNLLGFAPGAPEMRVSVARRDDVVLLSLGHDFLLETLARLDDPQAGPRLADDPRFVAAFKALPAAEDAQVFFDMNSMMRPIGELMGFVADQMSSTGEVYQNAGVDPEADALNSQALSAYRKRDYERALALVQQAYEKAPTDSIVLYNLACFHARVGHNEDALSWLANAVEGGFYAPRKIQGDEDLAAVRSDPRFTEIVDRAAELAAQGVAGDITLNASKSGEAYKLVMQARQAHDQKDYEQGLRLMEQARAAAPEDSGVLYDLACFHALLGQRDQAVDVLRRAVASGYYCPNHIQQDADMESVRSDPRFDAIVRIARERAAETHRQRAHERAGGVRAVVTRIMEAVGMLDYSATVEYTDGYAAYSDTISVMVPDAKRRDFYPVLASAPPIVDFLRKLPAETESFAIHSGLSLSALYDYILDTFRAVGPPGEELLQKWAQIQNDAGFNLKRDVLDWCGGEFAAVSLQDGGGSVWMLSVRDEDKARAAVGKLVDVAAEKIAQFASKSPALAMFAIQASPTDEEGLEGFQNIYVAIAPANPIVWGVVDDQLVVGTSAEAVALCLRTAAGEHPDIRQNARAMAELVSGLPGDCVGVSLTDQRGCGAQAAWIVEAIGPLTSAFTIAIPDEKARAVVGKIGMMVGKLGPVFRKIDFFKSSSTFVTFDGAAWRSRSATHYASPEERGSAATRTAPR